MKKIFANPKGKALQPIDVVNETQTVEYWEEYGLYGFFSDYVPNDAYAPTISPAIPYTLNTADREKPDFWACNQADLGTPVTITYKGQYSTFNLRLARQVLKAVNEGFRVNTFADLGNAADALKYKIFIVENDPDINKRGYWHTEDNTNWDRPFTAGGEATTFAVTNIITENSYHRADGNLTVEFNQFPYTNSVNSNNFVLEQGETPVAYAAGYPQKDASNEKKVILDPNANLADGATKLTVKGTTLNNNGDALTADVIRNFIVYASPTVNSLAVRNQSTSGLEIQGNIIADTCQQLKVEIADATDTGYTSPVVFETALEGEINAFNGTDDWLTISVTLTTGDKIYRVSVKDSSGVYGTPVSGTGFTVAGNTAPIASAVSITGTAQEGQVLTGNYTYSDAEGDLEGTSTFKWYSGTLSDGSDKVVISGATAQTYAVQSGDVGKYIFFEVIPIAQTGATTGTPVVSSASAKVETLAASWGSVPFNQNGLGFGKLSTGAMRQGSQSFLAGATGVVSKVSASLWKDIAFDTNTTVNILAELWTVDASDKPLSQLGISNNSIAGNTLPTGDRNIVGDRDNTQDFDFLFSGVNITNGTKYAIVLKLSATPTPSSEVYSWSASNGDPYTNGKLTYKDDAGAWTDLTGYDCGFKVYVTT